MVRAQVMAAKIPLMHVATIATHRFAVNADTMKKTRGKNFAQNVNQKTTIKMKTETPPTIAELWGELSTRHLRESERLQWDHMRENGQITEDQYKGHLDYVQSLRQQLLERCAIIPDSGGQSSIFTIDGNTLLIENTIDRLRHDNVDTLADFTNACNFWLWELGQRRKELGDGN